MFLSVLNFQIINLMTQEVTEDAGGPFYNRLSRATGGLTTVIDRSDIESVTQLFTALTTQGQVSFVGGNLPDLNISKNSLAKL